jgi:hypothetical protein
MKFGWWTKVSGRLNITGRRLDQAAPPVRGVVPDGYGSRGFQPSGVIFPTEGCWEITGSVHRTAVVCDFRDQTEQWFLTAERLGAG